jgi:hypothetical protein
VYRRKSFERNILKTHVEQIALPLQTPPLYKTYNMFMNLGTCLAKSALLEQYSKAVRQLVSRIVTCAPYAITYLDKPSWRMRMVCTRRTPASNLFLVRVVKSTSVPFAVTRRRDTFVSWIRHGSPQIIHWTSFHHRTWLRRRDGIVV